MADLVATDDDARLAGQFRYLGPAGWRFRNAHRDISYYVAFGLSLPSMALGAAFAPTFLVSGFALDTLVRVLCAALALWPASRAARALMRHVDVHRPIRWHAQTLNAEVRAPRPARVPLTATITPKVPTA